MPHDLTVAATLLRPERFLKKAEVCHRLGDIDPTTLFRWIKAGWFPKSVHPHATSRLTVWRESEIEAVLASAPPGQGWRPDAAIAANARRRADRKAAKAAPFNGPTPRFGFIRRAP